MANGHQKQRHHATSTLRFPAYIDRSSLRPDSTQGFIGGLEELCLWYF